VEYLNLFHVDEIPNEIYKKNPDSERFKDNLDVYLTVRDEDYMSEEHAWQNVLFYFKEFKIQLEPFNSTSEVEQEEPKVEEKPKKKSTRAKKQTPPANGAEPDWSETVNN
jgi:hypothetical protein